MASWGGFWLVIWVGGWWVGDCGCLILVIVFWGLGVWLDSLVLRLCVLWGYDCDDWLRVCSCFVIWFWLVIWVVGWCV